MHKNFVILFSGQEGSSPIMKLLNNFDFITMLTTSEGGIEPFDNINLSVENFRWLWQRIIKRDSLEEINALYRLANPNVINPYKNDIVGWKMRQRIFSRTEPYKLFREEKVKVFVLYRENRFEWALSRCHDKITKNLQFKLKDGRLKEIPPVKVNIKLFKDVLKHCDSIYQQKEKIVQTLSNEGISFARIFYEDFLNNRREFLKTFMDYLGIRTDIDKALEMGCYYEKVHKDYSTIINYNQLKDEFAKSKDSI